MSNIVVLSVLSRGASTETSQSSHPRAATTARYTKSHSQPAMKVGNLPTGTLSNEQNKKLSSQYMLTYLGELCEVYRNTEELE